jgi:YcaO-like protein with predicted kinase domain
VDSIASRNSDRICQSAETWERVEPLLRQLGIVRLSRLTGLDRVGIPVWNAVAPNSRSIVINQGKGVSDMDARVSAAMEALERAVACRPAAAVVEASPRELANSRRRFATLAQLIASNKSEIGDDETIAWIEGKDLLSKAAVLVPLEAVILDRTLENCRFWQSSDGLASGNNETEATLHALLERIERDADVLWRLRSNAGRLATCVDPTRFNDPVIDDLVGRYSSSGLDLRLFDLTSDISVPCYAAIVAERGILTRTRPRFHDVTVGYGAHLAQERAAIRALTEVAQSRLTIISGARDDIFAETYGRPLPSETQNLFGATPGALVRNASSAASGDPAALLEDVLSKLKSAGIKSAIAVPLHSPGLPVAVVKAIVPSLENPDGARKHRLGARALSLAISAT